MSLSLIKHWRALLTVALVLSLIGLKLGVLAGQGSDVPPPGEWATEAEGLYRPWVHRTSELSGIRNVVISRPDPGARALKLFWLRENSQWDPRFLALVAAGIFGLAAAVVFAAIIKMASPLAALILALGGFSFLAFPIVLESTLDAFQTWAGLLILFSAAHLGATALGRPRSRLRWAGHAAGLANVLASTAGITSPLALLVWIAVDQARWGGASLRRPLEQSQGRRRGGAPPHLIVLWNGILVVLGLARLFAGPHAPWQRMDLSALLHLGAWPLAWPAAALITCAPSVVLLLATSRRNPDDSPIPLARLGSIWVLILMAALACPGVIPAGGPPATLLAVGLLVQLSALAALPVSRLNGFIGKAVAAAVWLILIFDGLFQQSSRLPSIAQRAEFNQAQAAATRHFLAGQTPENKNIAGLLSDPQIRAILPSSIRPPLPIFPSQGSAGFEPGASPGLDGKPALLPVWGTWRPEGPHADGRFVSEPVRTAGPMLQIYVAGALRPPLEWMGLQTADGRVLPPIEPQVESMTRWKQLNFVVPSGPFRVVARDANPRSWLAFSAPLETSRLAWFGRKLAPSWPWILGFGVVLLATSAAGAVSEWWRERSETGPPQAVPALAKHAPWLGVFAYAVFLANFINIYAAASDASGYLNSAKLLLHGCLTLPPRLISGVATSLQLLTPLGFDVYRGRIAPGYPAGLPMMLAAVGRLTSLEFAIPAIVMVHLVLGIFFTRLLAKACGLGRTGAWVAAWSVGLCPLYVFMGLQPMSDVPSLVWVTAAIYFALRSREKPPMALWAGVACAVAVLLRPINLMCLLPIALVLGFSARRLRLLILGGLPGAIFAVWYNLRLFGSPFHTAYGDVGYLFRWHWVLPTLRAYALWIPAYFTPLIFLAAAGPWARGLIRPARMALAACVVIYFGFYSFYDFTHSTWWYLRFVLPAFPSLAILAVGAGKDLIARHWLRTGLWRPALAVVLLGLFAGNVAWEFSRLPILDSRRGNEFYRDSTLWIEEHAPKDAVVLAFQASGAVYFYTSHPLIRAEAGTPSEAETIAAVRRLIALGRPVYALIVPFDTIPPFAKLPGHWEQAARVKTAEIWEEK